MSVDLTRVIRRMPMRCAIGLMVAALLLLPGPISAQNLSSSSIDGVVSDESGAALPGVTVTATSPTLQVSQLNTVTDGQGHYRFIDLPRGTYQLRFEISGFEPLVRQDLSLSAGFAARVNVALKVGTLNETVTVSGASPVVDLSSTGGGQNVSTDLISFALPGLKQMADIIQMSPGLTAPMATNLARLASMRGLVSIPTGSTAATPTSR